MRPRKRFGQHFLERAWAEKVARAIEPRAGDVFLEIGPGRGAMTHLLGAAAARVLAFEIDRDLVPGLRERGRGQRHGRRGRFPGATAGTIGEELRRLGVSATTPLRVAGNLPYNVASPILFKLIELVDDGLPVSDAMVMLQREVADRLLAPPGTKDYGVLSVLIGTARSRAGARAAARRVPSRAEGAVGGRAAPVPPAEAGSQAAGRIREAHQGDIHAAAEDAGERAPGVCVQRRRRGAAAGRASTDAGGPKRSTSPSWSPWPTRFRRDGGKSRELCYSLAAI